MPNDVGATLKKLREDADVTVKAVSEYLIEKGFKANPSTIYSWETGNSQPTPGALLAMCKLYNVPDVLEAFGYDGYDSNGQIQLTLKETKLIEKYRTLDADGTKLIDTVLDLEFERCKEEDSDKVLKFSVERETGKIVARNGSEITEAAKQEIKNLLS